MFSPVGSLALPHIAFLYQMPRRNSVKVTGLCQGTERRGGPPPVRPNLPKRKTGPQTSTWDHSLSSLQKQVGWVAITLLAQHGYWGSLSSRGPWLPILARVPFIGSPKGKPARHLLCWWLPLEDFCLPDKLPP